MKLKLLETKVEEKTNNSWSIYSYEFGIPFLLEEYSVDFLNDEDAVKEILNILSFQFERNLREYLMEIKKKRDLIKFMKSCNKAHSILSPLDKEDDGNFKII